MHKTEHSQDCFTGVGEAPAVAEGEEVLGNFFSIPGIVYQTPGVAGEVHTYDDMDDWVKSIHVLFFETTYLHI